MKMCYMQMKSLSACSVKWGHLGQQGKVKRGAPGNDSPEDSMLEPKSQGRVEISQKEDVGSNAPRQCVRLAQA